MSIPQVVIHDVLWETETHSLTWNNPFLIPVYLALGLLVVQAFVTLRMFKRVSGIFWSLRSPSTSTHDMTTMPMRGFLDNAKQHIMSQGRITFLLNLLRLVGTLTLACLTTATILIPCEEDCTRDNIVGKWCWSFGSRDQCEQRVTSTCSKSTEIIQAVLYSYLSILASITIVSSSQWRSAVTSQLTSIMLAEVAVYTYRDLYPLVTFTLVPKDADQGWLLWCRIGVALFVGVVVPVFTPRMDHTVSISDVGKDVTPEQAASWFSFLTFSFLDQMIWLAARTSHLGYDSLPPLASHDAATHLMAKSKKILDPSQWREKTHLFWNLMSIFASECALSVIILTLKAATSFVAPLGINRLLAHLETNGGASFIKPWVWILCLFLGPSVGSIATQYYMFLSTRSMVHMEGILTQLVFDHALRIRLSDEGGQNGASTLVPDTLETRRITELGEDTIDDEMASQRSVSPSISSTKSIKVKGTKTTTILNTKHFPATLGPDGAKRAPEVSNLSGKINNHVTTDLGNITEGRDFMMLVLYGPLQMTLCFYFLYKILGWSALIGMSVMIFTLPIPGYMAKLMNKVQTVRMEKTDARVQTVTEILSVIRMTKLFGWEERMNNMITEKRDTELLFLKRRQLLDFLNKMLNFFLPVLTMFVTFTLYTTVQDESLNASILFSSMAIFGMFREVLHESTYLLPVIINAKVSLDRINNFLLNTKILDHIARQETDFYQSHDISSEMIGFRNATFVWDGTTKEENATLSRRRFCLTVEGELFFQPQKINLVIGPTGSGKTSLLMALLGEMHYEPHGESAGFNLPRDGGVAYTAQEGWVQSETIKNNILFGNPYEKKRYDKVIYQCGLQHDLDLFEAGDATQVGEKGLTLSGGQKARITLARAMYSDAQILLLDDILAALDVHTAKFIVDKCLQGDLMEGRTIIIVTHNVGLVSPIADFVISLDLDGRIASQGILTKDLRIPEDTTVNEVVEKVEAIDMGDEEIVTVKSVVPEEISIGHLGRPALMLYFSGLGGVPFWFAVLGGLLVTELALSLATWFLGYWTSDYEEHPGLTAPAAFYLSIYALIILFTLIAYSVANSILVIGSIETSRKIHQKLITSVLGTTLRWLDTIPTARIIARCTLDMRAVDGPMSQSLASLLYLTMALIVKFCSAVIFAPVFILPGIAISAVGGACGQLYMKAQLSIKREVSNRRSHVLAHFGAAMFGLTSIRAYNAQAMFRSESLKRIDEYTRAAKAFHNCNRWVCIRLDAIGGLFTMGLAAILVYGPGLRSASNTGFSLTMAVSFSSIILWWLRDINEFEVQGNSLERIESYVNIEQEPRSSVTGKPPASWPASGTLKVDKLYARYSGDDPWERIVLHNISFEVRAGERVGIVGRTGSGKSSLALSFLRCIPTVGHVILDGIATDTINLHALRSSITIIPQQPELLSGTLRENLDPFSEHSDAILNDALREAGLFTLQDESDSLKITLDSSVSSGGRNLSIGQRQILALARAIVRKSKLLILDEATSAIDYATDKIIQDALRRVLKDVTLIIIAHRLQTVMDADKIMVLDAGRMVEFDSPANLLKKKDGYFCSLVSKSGDRDVLLEIMEAANVKKQGTKT